MDTQKLYDSGYQNLFDICHGNLDDLPKEDALTIHSKDNFSWRVNIARISNMHRDLKELHELAVASHRQGALTFDEQRILTEAEQIMINVNESGYAIHSRGDDWNNVLFNRLAEHITPTPFVELQEYGACLSHTVYIGNRLYKLNPKEFREQLEDMAVELHKDVSAFSQGETEYEDSIRRFAMSFPSYAVRVYGFKDPLPIVDDFDTDQDWRAVCAAKEDLCIANIVAQNVEEVDKFLQEHAA